MAEKVLAFSFSAGEFLEEELAIMEEKYGKDIAFIKEGECRTDHTTQHPYQWWAPQEACDEINKLISSEKDEQPEL